MVVFKRSYHIFQFSPTFTATLGSGGIIGIVVVIFNMLLKSISVIHIPYGEELAI